MSNPVRVPNLGEMILKGHGNRWVGPSDSSDTGSDMVGIEGLDNTSDRQGTGERVDVEEVSSDRAAADLMPDRIVSAEQAGLGGGLDQAEEAQLGITDEELEAGEDDE